MLASYCPSSCLNLPNTRVTGILNHTWPSKVHSLYLANKSRVSNGILSQSWLNLWVAPLALTTGNGLSCEEASKDLLRGTTSYEYSEAKKKKCR